MLTAGQITGIVLLSLVEAAVIAFGVFLLFRYRQNSARQLCTIQLTQKREELLAQLDAMRSGLYTVDGREVPVEDEEEEEELKMTPTTLF